MESGSGRAGGNAERFGNLRRFEARVVSKGEQHALLDGQSSEAALQLVPVGDAEELIVRRWQVHREDAELGNEAAIARRLGDAGADDEAVQPRVETVRIAERGQIAPGDHQCFLHSILGPIDVAEDPLRDRVEAVAANTDQVGISLPVTASSSLHEIVIHCAVYLVTPSGGVVRTLWEPRVRERSN